MYQNGTALDCNDLLDKLRLFLISAGWTVNFWGLRTATSNGGRNLSVSKAGVHGTFHTDLRVTTGTDPGPWLFTSTHASYAANADPDVLPLRSAVVITNKMAGPFKQHFFFEGDDGGIGGSPYIHVVVETSTGFFKHFGIGKMQAPYALANGGFATGSNWYYSGNATANDPDNPYSGRPWHTYYDYSTTAGGTVVRADTDGISPNFFFGDSQQSNTLKMGCLDISDSFGQNNILARSQPSSETGRNVLMPFITSVLRPSGYYSYIGQAPGVRYVDVTYLVPEQELTIGLDVWKVFPMHRKIHAPEQPFSGRYGYAYKKN